MAALVPLLVGAREAAGQDGARADVRVTGALPARTLAGAVYDAGTGRPLPGAAVRLEDAQAGAVTDSLGRFRFEAPRTGSFQLGVSLIGYDAVREPVHVPPDEGVALAIALRETRVPACGLVVCAGPGGDCANLVAWVRDVLTAGPPRVPVMLRILSRVESDSVTATPAPGASDALVLAAGRALRHRGPYRLEVAAPGYALWQRHDVYRSECPGFVQRDWHVWLVPLRN